MADYGSRAGAFVIDLLAAFVPPWIVAFMLSGAVWVDLISPEIFGGIIAAVIVVELIIFVYFWFRSQSPGKAAISLQVVKRDGRPAGPVRMLLREILLKGIMVGVLWVTLIGPILWYLWPLWDKQRRAPHDIILGTFVVRRGGVLKCRRG